MELSRRLVDKVVNGKNMALTKNLKMESLMRSVDIIEHCKNTVMILTMSICMRVDTSLTIILRAKLN